MKPFKHLKALFELPRILVKHSVEMEQIRQSIKFDLITTIESTAKSVEYISEEVFKIEQCLEKIKEKLGL